MKEFPTSQGDQRALFNAIAADSLMDRDYLVRLLAAKGNQFDAVHDDGRPKSYGILQDAIESRREGCWLVAREIYGDIVTKDHMPAVETAISRTVQRLLRPELGLESKVVGMDGVPVKLALRSDRLTYASEKATCDPRWNKLWNKPVPSLFKDAAHTMSSVEQRLDDEKTSWMLAIRDSLLRYLPQQEVNRFCHKKIAEEATYWGSRSFFCEHATVDGNFRDHPEWFSVVYHKALRGPIATIEPYAATAAVKDRLLRKASSELKIPLGEIEASLDAFDFSLSSIDVSNVDEARKLHEFAMFACDWRQAKSGQLSAYGEIDQGMSWAVLMGFLMGDERAYKWYDVRSENYEYPATDGAKALKHGRNALLHFSSASHEDCLRAIKQAGVAGGYNGGESAIGGSLLGKSFGFDQDGFVNWGNPLKARIPDVDPVHGLGSVPDHVHKLVDKLSECVREYASDLGLSPYQMVRQRQISGIPFGDTTVGQAWAGGVEQTLDKLALSCRKHAAKLHKVLHGAYPFIGKWADKCMNQYQRSFNRGLPGNICIPELDLEIPVSPWKRSHIAHSVRCGDKVNGERAFIEPTVDGLAWDLEGTRTVVTNLQVRDGAIMKLSAILDYESGIPGMYIKDAKMVPYDRMGQAQRNHTLATAKVLPAHVSEDPRWNNNAHMLR